ncbi:MAG: 16S rRNA (adenine(1518)-N(6)/adenine(1519)-N(6))-dimethyltransferase RsmA [SAR324 cluster bacterium]|nr:16S rRNA (adenine(1518)-N(6)/adenine(1519)-N(6))-dimethyltransferase RsmA [SAR324 cluster bacterium]
MGKTKKRFGQHFLINEQVLGDIIYAGNPDSSDHVIEIGPGQGVLTDLLLKSGAKVTAIEIDRDLIKSLNVRFGHLPNFTLLNQDALQMDWFEFLKGQTGVKLIANLPYNISSPLFLTLMRVRKHFASWTVMLQKEVALRLTAAPSSGKAYGSLSISAGLFFEGKWIVDVPPESFSPAPKVDSAVIQLIPNTQEVTDLKPLLRFFQQAFTTRRKKLAGRIKQLYPDCKPELLESLGNRRPEELGPKEFLQLYEDLEKPENT